MIGLLMMLFVPAVVAADGHWATLRQGGTCEAASRSLGVVYKDREPARASTWSRRCPAGLAVSLEGMGD